MTVSRRIQCRSNAEQHHRVNLRWGLAAPSVDQAVVDDEADSVSVGFVEISLASDDMPSPLHVSTQKPSSNDDTSTIDSQDHSMRRRAYRFAGGAFIGISTQLVALALYYQVIAPIFHPHMNSQEQGSWTLVGPEVLSLSRHHSTSFIIFSISWSIAASILALAFARLPTRLYKVVLFSGDSALLGLEVSLLAGACMGGWIGWKVIDAAFECAVLRTAYAFLIIAVLLVCLRVVASAYQRQKSARSSLSADGQSALDDDLDLGCLGRIL